jgi:hypothetical protein
MTQVVQTTTTQAQHAARQARVSKTKLVFGWIQDVSGSMRGRRIERSLEGLDYMTREIFKPNDFLGVMAYNGDINTMHAPMPVKKVDMERDKAAILRGIDGNSAFDRMYDSIGKCIKGLQAMVRNEDYIAVTKDAVYKILLLTDGGDNYSSEYTLEQAAELIAHPGLPNFHFVVVAVEMSARDKQKLQVLCEPDHATFVDVSKLSDLGRTLEEVGKRLQQRRLLVTTTTTTVSVVRELRPGGFIVSDLDGLDSMRLPLMRLAPLQLTPPPRPLPLLGGSSGRGRGGDRGAALGSSGRGRGQRDRPSTSSVGSGIGARPLCRYLCLPGRCREGNEYRFLHIDASQCR